MYTLRALWDVWDVFGHIVAEHLVGSGLQREYVRLGDTPIAVYDAGAAEISYVHVYQLERPIRLAASKFAVRIEISDDRMEPEMSQKTKWWLSFFTIGLCPLGLVLAAQFFQAPQLLALNPLFVPALGLVARRIGWM